MAHVVVTHKRMGALLDRSKEWIKARKKQLASAEVIHKRPGRWGSRGPQECWCIDAKLLEWAENGGMKSKPDPIVKRK